MLPDKSVLIEQKLAENAKIQEFAKNFVFLVLKADFKKEVFCTKVTIALVGNLRRKPGNLNRQGITISSFILL